ncbi:hypothetical protein COEREDRAFT_94163 [Coemansia reversa NRRL 1564]|uniref:Peptidase S1 domain-containing protein n=1 Tax=Coemansia reversa (strain ATCC 12441 / NRRL 1564) TaxID=763665 RepID=A0A2G5B4Z5_COERN|nr:hypothetical protein COEREDRAFT_94163 [Coemansia reversa NRRL 1564]|eukprot:PIA14070.1 hypothetical protein COEREDRAFT_94163 [Coemansia reversa NRRL 1564]
MSSSRFLFLFIYTFLAFITSYYVQAGNFFQPGNIRSRGGILVKNGEQTSCEVALIDSGSGFVAATCITDSRGKIDVSSQFEIYTDSSKKGQPASATIISSAISVHPDFDLGTFANNIAIIQFSLRPAKSWHIPIAVNRDEWESIIFVRRHMNSISDMEWANAITTTNALTDPECASDSSLFAANKIDFKCSSASAPAIEGSKCDVPYGTVYGVVGGSASLAGLYSHSVIDNYNICISKKTDHYYTLLSNYVAFAQSVLGRDVTIFTNTAFSINTDALYKMEAVSSESLDGTRLVAGNVFKQTGNNPLITASAFEKPNQSTNFDDSTPALSQSSDSHSAKSTDSVINMDVVSAGTDDNSSESEISFEDAAQSVKNKMSSGHIAAIAVSLTIFCIVALLGAYFALKWYRKRQTTKWNTEQITQILDSHIVSSEFGSTPSTKFELPSYRNHRATMLVAAGPNSIE